MEGRAKTGKRFDRDGDKPRLAEAPRPDSAVSVDADLDAESLLTRLEALAAENGRLQARAEALERAAEEERDARRRLAETLKRERRAARALHLRAERERKAHVEAQEELERLRESVSVTEHHVQHAWSRLAEADRRLAHHERGFWQRLLRRPPRVG